MALLGVESFKFSTASGDYTTYGRWQSTNQTWTINTSGGPIGSGPFIRSSTGAGTAPRMQSRAHTARAKVFWRGYIRGNSATAQSSPCVSFFDSIAGADQCSVRFNMVTGAISAERGSIGGTSIGTTGASVIGISTWYFVEIRLEIHDTAGIVQVWVNDVLTLDISTGTVDTKATANATCDRFAICTAAAVAGGTTDWASLSWNDDQGSRWNTKMGERFISGRFSNADFSVAFTPSTGTINSNNVDDTAISTADFNYGVPSVEDLYSVPTLSPSLNSVDAIAVSIVTQKDDAGARTIATSISAGGTIAHGSDVALLTSYVALQQIFEIQPSGSAWTPSAASTVKIGAKVTG